MRASSSAWRGLAWCALFALLVGFAYAPLLRAGFLSWDYACLLGNGTGGPLGVAWSRASEGLWGLPPLGSSAGGWRLESLVGLCALALAGAALLERLLEPWLGERSARAAARALAFLAVLHPLSVPAVARIAGRTEIAGGFLALTAAWLFLRGRQEEHEALVLASFPVMIVAGLASDLVIPMAFLAALAEFGAVRRHRRRTVRLRTASTTGVLFGVAALLPRFLVEDVFHLQERTSGGEPGLRGLLHDSAETLGNLVLPEGGLGTAGAILAGALLVVAARSAFRAARHAPRLWGSVLFAWTFVLAAALLALGASSRVAPVLAVTVWAAGLALALAPMRASRQRPIVLGLALGFAILTHGASRPWLIAAGVQGRLCQDLRGATPGAGILLLDPPRIPGLPPLGADLSWNLHPRLEGGESVEGFDEHRVRSLSSEAFLALASSAQLDGLRAQRPWIVARTVPLASLESRAVPVALAAPASAPETLVFKELAFTPPSPLDPLQWEHASVVAELAADPREIETLAWSGPDGAGSRLLGEVTERGARRAADFDLSASLDWRLSGSVRSLLLEKGVRGIERGELHRFLPEIPGIGEPERGGADWTFALAGGPKGLAAGGRFELGLLAGSDFTWKVVPVVLDGDTLRGAGAEAFVHAHARPEAPVSWFLDYRVGSHVQNRARGHVP